MTNGTGNFNKGKFVKELDKTFGADKYTLSTDASILTIDGKEYETGLPGKWSKAKKNAMTENNITEVTGNDIENNNLKDETKIKAVIKDEDNAQIPIPVDAEYLEGKESTGVVIKYKESEFVWVPVQNAVYESSKDEKLPKAPSTGSLTANHNYTPMAINTGTTEIPVYKGLLYSYDATNGAYLNYASESPYQGSTSQYIEPAYISGSNYDDNTEYGNKFSSDDIQQSYKSMVESVAKYGGFFVGRYETSINETTSKAQSIADVSPSNAKDEATNKWYGLYQKQKDFTTIADKMSSEMIWGSQYDAMLNWAVKGTDKAHVTSKSNATHNNTYNATTLRTKTTTDNDIISAIDRINNIYDLEGNLCEWTQESNITNNRVIRGGSYIHSNSPSYRYYNYPTISYDGYGSRLSLYINV